VSSLLIATPMGVEALLVRAGARRARVRRTGMGPRRARAAAAALLGEPGETLLVLGFCGALHEDAVPGEVVVAEEVLTAPDEGDGSEPVRCARVDELAAALAGGGLSVRRGAVVCVGRLALGERLRRLGEGGAIAVDMESVWLAQGAGERPFSVVRVVLDSPSHELLRPGAAIDAVRAGRALRRAAAVLGRGS
jgi:4-hydroxy-3-methylbut-2-enyl diphosphate reductase